MLGWGYGARGLSVVGDSSSAIQVQKEVLDAGSGLNLWFCRGRVKGRTRKTHLRCVVFGCYERLDVI